MVVFVEPRKTLEIRDDESDARLYLQQPLAPENAVLDIIMRDCDNQTYSFTITEDDGPAALEFIKDYFFLAEKTPQAASEHAQIAALTKVLNDKVTNDITLVADGNWKAIFIEDIIGGVRIGDNQAVSARQLYHLKEYIDGLIQKGLTNGANIKD